MLVSDLRNLIKNYTPEEKDKIIVELYKRVPKTVKENYDIDNYISNIRENNKLSKEKKVLSVDDLFKEVRNFILCTNNGLYASPNKVIPKTQRSKWRFQAKKYYKDLNSIPADSHEGAIATDLLDSLFRVLSTGSCYLTFSSFETFRAIQVSQRDFLETVMKRKLATGVNKEILESCASLLDIDYDPYELHANVLLSFSSCLKTSDMRYLAIDVLKASVDKKKEKLTALKKDKKGSSHSIYECEKSINYFVECITYIYFDLCEIDKGIAYFHKNYIESNKEVKEYIILDWLDFYELYDFWIKEYEKHVNVGYRESLKEKYKELLRKVGI